MQTEERNTNQIRILPMLVGAAATFCATSLFILVVFHDNVFDLLFYLAYMTVACTMMPLPTPTIVMRYGGDYSPLLIAVLGGIGSCVSGLIDYILVTVLLRHEKVARIKTTRAYLFVERLFNKLPFVSIVVAAFTPIPFEPVRLLACATQYSRFRFLLAIFVGRTPRYYLLARLQRLLLIPRAYLYGVIIVLTVIEITRRLVKRFLRRRGTEIQD